MYKPIVRHEASFDILVHAWNSGLDPALWLRMPKNWPIQKCTESWVPTKSFWLVVKPPPWKRGKWLGIAGCQYEKTPTVKSPTTFFVTNLYKSNIGSWMWCPNIQFHGFFLWVPGSPPRWRGDALHPIFRHQMLGTGLLLCRFPVVSWHLTAPKVHLDWMWHWKMARSNATRTELYCAIVTHRETERNKYRLHRALISCSESIQWLIIAVGAGDSRWLASSGFPFCWTIIWRRHVQSFRIRFLLCYLMRAKKSCLKCWNIFVFFCHITALLQLICSWLSVIHWISKR